MRDTWLTEANISEILNHIHTLGFLATNVKQLVYMSYIFSYISLYILTVKAKQLAHLT